MDKDKRDNVLKLAGTLARENVSQLKRQKREKQKKWLIPAVVLLAVTFLGFGGWLASQPKAPPAPVASTSSHTVQELPRVITDAELLQNFSGVAVKRLSATDIDPATSHQHEITGVKALQKVFGTEDLRLRGRLLYFGERVFSTDVDLTWYNASKTGPPRWRLYYRDNPVTKAAKPGDSLVVTRYGKDEVLAIVTPEDSKYQAQIFSLLKLKGAAAVANDVGKNDAKKVVSDQLQQTGKVPVQVSIWKDVDTNEITVEGKVEKVKDGDTINISGLFDIRLLGIDAPEHNQTCAVDGKEWDCGEAAAKYLSSLVMGKEVSCTNKKKEKYGRYLSVCKVDGQDVNRLMVEKGLAVVYYSDEYAAAEREARTALRGLWNSEFINPEDFRHMKR